MKRSRQDIAEMTQSGLNLIKQAISIYDSDLRLVVSNQRFKDMFGLPQNLLERGADFSDTIRYLATSGDYGVVDDVEQFVRERVEQARDFQPHYVERVRDNGMHISVEGSPLRQGGWVTVYTDITEIHRQEDMLRSRSDELNAKLIRRSQELEHTNRALQASITALEEAKRELTETQARTQMTAEMMPAHLAHVDVNGCYTYTNHKLDTVVPNRPHDIIGLHFEQALGTEAYHHIRPQFEDALSGQSNVFEFALRDENRKVRVAFTPEVDTDGEVVGVYLLSMDITAESQAREALTHARRRELTAQLTSGMAHDFANLLTIILGQQNKLESLADLPAPAKEIVETTKAAALRGGALLDGLANLSAQRNLRLGTVEMAKFAKGFSQLAHAAVPENITLDIRNLTDGKTLLLDQGFTQDALLNLVLNAAEAMNGAGVITITIHHVHGDWLEFNVSDTGPGFSAPALENGFAPFFTTKKNNTGRGLGLSTVFDYAKLCDGHAHIGNHENGGFVKIQIPYREAEIVPDGLVLLVEDTDEIRKTVRGYLRAMGHSVIEATSGEEAMELRKIPNITHIVTDLMLAGDMTGLDLAQKLRESDQDTPVLIVTGLPQSNKIHQKARETFPLLGKPFSQEELQHMFQSISK
ncbi:signal transduction histidine kinase [Amylibacter ulvae]|uniref:histidine kinase n=1 Tax=Paramylibacter ulvae TaxID=1651968 RepID=A0ABQ3D046_9RHOB|nr:PAS-domain containing protein [Amylibacter ulvae]GHA51074.1 signal transduction histidine kinase [Amylibacter ulvae]